MDDLDGLLGSVLEDPEQLGRIMGVVGAISSGDSGKEKLFDALTPYLKEERRRELMSAVRLARLIKAARLMLKENGEDHV